MLRDGTTIVEDLRHRAFQLFDANGEFLRTVRMRGSIRYHNLLPDPRGGGVFIHNAFDTSKDDGCGFLRRRLLGYCRSILRRAASPLTSRDSKVVCSQLTFAAERS